MHEHFLPAPPRQRAQLYYLLHLLLWQDTPVAHQLHEQAQQPRHDLKHDFCNSKKLLLPLPHQCPQPPSIGDTRSGPKNHSPQT